MMSAVAALLARRSVVAWLPVVVIAPVLVLDAALIHDGGPQVTVWGVLAAIVACLPLVVRDRLPFVAMAPLLTAGIVLVLWLLEPGDTVVLIPSSPWPSSPRAATGATPCGSGSASCRASSSASFRSSTTRASSSSW
jgi:hypothetical protein